MSGLSFHLPGDSDKAVLLIHGLTGAPSEMRYLGKQLHRQGFTVDAPLLAGHGEGLSDLKRTNWQDWYASVEAAYLRLRESHAQVYTAGICAGGALGLMLGARHRDLAGITIFSPTLKYDGWTMPWYCAFTPLILLASNLPLFNRIRFSENWPYGLKNERLRARVQAGENLVSGSLESFPIRSLHQMHRLSAEVRRRLPDIRTPTQLIHAEEDDVSHPRNARYIAKHIGGPCTIEWLKESYHMLHVDQERKRVAEMTGRFFGAPEKEALHAA